MRIEELFGRARKSDEQTMGQWIAHLKSQLREVGVEVGRDRVANRIVNGLGKEYQGIKCRLKARSGTLKVDVVTQHLLAAEMELNRKNNLQHLLPPQSLIKG